jgi:uncharacterized membrane protein YdbT with pleckstrin-like domain
MSSPDASPQATLGATAEIMLADQLLGDGEQIILTARPSPWFILLSSLPILAGLLAATVLLAASQAQSVRPILLPGCLLLGGLQLAFASLRWLGRIYVLTNLRVMRISGLIRHDVYDIDLARILDVQVTRSRLERPLGLGSLQFRLADNPYAEPGWVNLPDADAVAEEIRRAIHHRRNRPPNPHAVQT